MFSSRILYWIPYLVLSFAVSASAESPLTRIQVLEGQVRDLHRLQVDVVPLIERIEARLDAIEHRGSQTAALEQEVASLRRSVGELLQQQKNAERRQAALEKELRTMSRALAPSATANRPGQPAMAASPSVKLPPRPKLFRSESVPRSSPRSEPIAPPPPRPLGPDDAEYWRRLREDARQSLLASRQRNGLGRW